MTPLRQRMLEDMRVRNLACNTQLSYLQQVSVLPQLEQERAFFR
jgi:integrase/recombinase XerD